MQECRFQTAECPPQDVRRLQVELSISRALAQVLVRRGLADPAAAREFLHGGAEHPADAFAGIERAVESILGHVRAADRITIHGDYDVDGVCSTAVLVSALRDLGADVDSYLPDRAEGYGLSVRTVRRLAARGTRLLITADCGVSSVEEVREARALGLDVVVSDHHAPRPDGVLPDAPIVHPALCGYPFPELCATAVAYKLAQALFAAAGRDPATLRRELDLVALATVADVVTLRGENRELLRRGLRVLAGTPRPGLRALMAVAQIDPARVDERAIGYALAPRLNAAGRLYRADAGLELVLTADHKRAMQVAQELDAANHERRALERRIRFEAEAQMAELGERPAYVLAAEGWHPGVIGIVASRMVESSGRPVVMVALDGERAKGSGRSIEAFDLLAGLQSCSEHLLRFGGHRAAAGVELARERVGDFAEQLAAYAETALAGCDLRAVEHVDAIVAGEELGMELAEELAAMAPFGRGNPSVCLMLEQATFCDPRPMGEGRHVRFTVQSGGARARAVAFGAGARLPVPEGEPAQATFTLEVNEWRGVSEPRLVLRRARAAPEVRADRSTPVASVDAHPLEPALAGQAPVAVVAEESPEPAELVLFAID